jgi:pyrroline-5-carboxylate reductase
MKILVLGAGKMVEAIALGKSSSNKLSDWGIFSPSKVSAQALATKCGAQFVPELSADLNPEFLIVGCKPQQLQELKTTLNDQYKDAVYISLLAAVDEKTQADILGVKKLIRVMPNLSVKYQEGVTLLSSNSAPEYLSKVSSIFSELGLVKVVEESVLEELTLLTGSGPGLFYEFTRELSLAFNSLPEEEREMLAKQVLLGAGINAKYENQNLTSLTQSVTSKGGVTIAVLMSWREQGLSQVLKAGISAGLKRSMELKKTILRS